MTTKRTRLALLPTIVASALVAGSASLLAYGCSATAETSSTGTDPTGNGGSGGGVPGNGGTGGDSKTSSRSASDASSTAQGIFFDGGDGGTFEDDAACLGQSVEAKLVPLDMILLLDRSGSMNTANLWDAARNAIKAFVNESSSEGIAVGLNYFPLETDECNYQQYQSLEVPVAELPGNIGALETSLDATEPSGGTPSYVAMKGTLFTATTSQTANPTHKTVMVFISDGEPSGCEGAEIDNDNLPGDPTHEEACALVAGKAFNFNGVQTHVLALPGVDKSVLDPIAKAGGTGTAIDVSSDVTQFAAKMAEIREAALSCDFEIPAPPKGETLDPSKVNVKFTDKLGNVFKYPKVAGANSCNGATGWYYDNEVTPKKILLCPASCSEVKNDKSGKFEVTFGCKSDVT